MFYQLRVNHINQETQDTVSISFDIPSHLKEIFRYTPGQYITLKASINGEEIRRAYSICSIPTEELSIGVKRVVQGKMSSYLNAVLKVGDILEVIPPEGRFGSQVSTVNEKNYLFFAGGSGITPILSMLKNLLSVKNENKIGVVYASNRDTDIIFKNQLDVLAGDSRLEVIHVIQYPSGTWTGEMGLLNEQKIKRILETKLAYIDSRQTDVYICGPSQMMDVVQSSLASLTFPDANIFVEYFTAKAKTEASLSKEKEANREASITVTCYGEVFDVSGKYNMTILDASLDAGLDPPYSCMAAACCSCRAKIEEGEVYMRDNEVLTDEEIAQGYVLTCQAEPRSAVIKVNFDL